ncbi:reactive intermediate/imine deaminase [Frigoribacterium sp. Leaf263]|uniref:Rid family detoxifying hydrolase n=1 Tax=Frigoribacterium sp. Leaf263 TaxID=1736313 RepID=UPI0006F43AB3|nr:Rid family detoxifying hydrolase [Frigoribacterium sp. Leaf263]KQO81597.1 reactive intermediate/imine deaminase [Frigoribacterium sp. Leaf263]
MPRSTTFAPDAPAAIGPYAHAAEPSGARLLFLSGQTPIDPATARLVTGDVAMQTRQVFANLETVLAAAGGTLADVVKFSVYLTTMDNFAEMNEVYASLVQEPYPARTTVAVAGLPLGARIEIEAIASLS